MGWIEPSSHRNVQEKCKGNSVPMGQKVLEKSRSMDFPPLFLGSIFLSLVTREYIRL